METRCPDAEPVNVARLDGWKFIIMSNGYASIVRRPGSVVHGVLWRLSLRDRSALDAYEGLSSGLYARRSVSVAWQGRRVSAMAYIGGTQTVGIPKPGYLDWIVAAAREWELPESYVGELLRWLPTGLRASRARETGEIS
jgi:hypothetical protein